MSIASIRRPLHLARPYSQLDKQKQKKSQEPKPL